MHLEATPLGSTSQRLAPQIDVLLFEHALHALVVRTMDSAPGLAVRRAVSSLAHVAIPGPKGMLAEVSVGYVATGASVGRHSARAGLDLVLDVVGRKKLNPKRAREAGFELRELNGGRRGPLWLLGREAVEALRSVRAWLVETGLDVGSPPGTWQKLQPEALRTRGYLPCARAGSDRAHCPHHDDNDPSLRLFGSGLSGAGYCHGCASPVHWTTAADDSVWTRPTSRSSSPGSSFVFGPPETTSSCGSSRVRSRPPAVLGGVRPGGTLGSAAFAELAEVEAGYVSGRRESRGMRRTWARPVLEALVWADRSGKAAHERAYRAAYAVARGDEGQLPDRFLSVSPMRALRVELRRVPGDDDDARRAIAVPTLLEAHSQEWVLVDIDDLAQGFGRWRDDACRAIADLIRRDPWLTGRCAIVETSSTGVQVWAELAHVQTDPRAWWNQADVLTWYARLSARVLVELRQAGREGGHVDTTAAAPGRYGRRPGWRLEDGWVPFRSRLLAAVEDPKRGPEPPSAIRSRWRVSRGRR